MTQTVIDAIVSELIGRDIPAVSAYDLNHKVGLDQVSVSATAEPMTSAANGMTVAWRIDLLLQVAVHGAEDLDGAVRSALADGCFEWLKSLATIGVAGYTFHACSDIRREEPSSGGEGFIIENVRANLIFSV